MGVLTRGDTRRRLILLVAALGLVAASVVLLPIGSSRAAEIVEQSEGVLLLSVDSDGQSWVRYYPDADPGSGVLGTSTAQQLINVSNKCGASTNGSLLAISQVGASKGLGEVSNGLGVRTKNNCSTAQGRIGSGQSLTFALGNGAALPTDVLIKSAEVDVEGKFSADLAYSVVTDDGPEAGRVSLPNTSDNGPDSGIGDNNVASIAPSGYFTAITFSPDGGEVSIEGGGDGLLAGGPLRTALGVNETLFELVTVTEYAGIIDCGQPTPPVGDATTIPQATFTRGDDNVLGKPGGGDCDTLIGFNLSSTNDGQQVIGFEFQEEELPSWFGEFTWAPEEAVVPVPATQIDEDGDDVFEADLLWCDGFSGGIDPETGDPIPNLPGDANWCLIGQQSVLLDGGLMQVSQEVYGLTDPRWAR